MDAFLQFSFIPFKFASAWFAFLVAKRFLAVKPGAVRQILFYIIHIITIGSTVYIGEPETMIVMGIIYMGGVCLLCGGRLIGRFSIGLILFSIAIAADAFLSNTPPPVGWFLPQINLALWLVFWLVLHKAFPQDKAPVIESIRLLRLLVLLAVMPVGSVFSIVGLTVLGREHVNPDPHLDTLIIPNEPVIMVILALAALSSIGLATAIIILARHERLEQEQALAQMRNQYYAEVEGWQGQVRQLRHDMANHLTAMSGLDDAGMRAYLDSLVASPAMAAPRRYCENEVVNSVVSSKLHALESGHIQTDFSLNIPRDIPISEIDLCALFANSLDNAIEAVLKLPEEQRTIVLHANTIEGMFMCRVENTMAGKLNKRDGVIATTKKDSANHGFGLRGIRNIVERNKGTMQVQQVGQTFQLTISLCI
ncbi:GHKL domain-containing protein [Ruminococcaceae bacterium OttesenSCG-928-L11]|nr:GHKL domain-containing protein [Ruminococcaceae bacterium OttesenSCG-928-L11]